MFETRCVSCIHLTKTPDTTTCALLKIPINPEEDTCPYHSDEIQYCTLCRKQFIGKPNLTEHKGIFITLCPQCNSLLGRCPTCTKANKCELQTDTSMPTTIRRQIQQNGMIFEQDVINPSKIEKCCKPCECFSEEFGCFKQNSQCCNNYELGVSEN